MIVFIATPDVLLKVGDGIRCAFPNAQIKVTTSHTPLSWKFFSRRDTESQEQYEHNVNTIKNINRSMMIALLCNP